MKSIHTYLHCMGIALSVLIISVPLMHVQAYDLPESTDTELPTLFPAPGEEGLPLLPQQTMDLPAVTDIVWASILQTAQKDNEIAELLNDVPVLLSGILEIQGKDHLYLGIERSYHNTHGSTNIAELLNKKFPGVPIYIEASDGVQTQAAKEEEETTIFSENFENGLTQWTALAFFSDGWLAHDDNDDNTVAQAQSCPWGCVLVTKQTINLENYDEVTLTFERWTKNSSLAVQINNETIKQYTGDSTKKTETITIDSRNNARISFVATGDTASVDNVTITGIREQEEEAISITRPTATITGSTVTLTTTITNTGNVASTTKTLKFYRHRTSASNPTAGAHLSTSTIGTLNQNESTTKTITTTTPTVTETTRYYYYACIDDTCSEPATIQVQPAVQEPETAEDITITGITAAPISSESGASVTIQVTVRNGGAVAARSKNIRFYRHTGTTNTPARGGTRLSTVTTTGAINANASVTRTVTITAPTVTETTGYYYYACIDTTCSESAVIHVQPKPQEPVTVTVPEPPYENCWRAPVRRTPMGGDRVFRQKGTLGVTGCSTITLGGLETTDGTRGFVMSGHGADRDETPFQTPDSTYFSHDRKIEGVLGRVFKMPRIRTEGVEFVVADAAFIAYPRSNTLGCSVTWRYENKTYCFDTGQGEYTEGIAPLTIRGRGNNMYKVVGSRQSVRGLEINLTGSVTGVHEDLRVIATEFLVEGEENYYSYVGVASNAVGSQVSIDGDSGSPIYTIPDENGTVQIVGIHRGNISFDFNEDGKDIVGHTFSSWDDVIDALDLKPISP